MRKLLVVHRLLEAEERLAKRERRADRIYGAADTVPMLRAGVGDAYSGPPGRGAWSPEGAAWAISSAAPGYALLPTRPGGHKQTRRVKLALAAQQPM